MAQRTARTALVLAGGVAKGAFEAGALAVLAEAGLAVGQVVGTSSGALNALMYAAAVRAGRERDATRRLVELWQRDASWMHFFHVDLRDALEGRGLSDASRVLQLMRDEIPRIATARVHPVGLRIVVAALQGVGSQIARHDATTFEGVLAFEGEDFDDDAGRERIYTATAASASFPLLFVPVEVPGLGACYDGGLVNNSPVALATDAGADHVIIIAPYPAAFHADRLPTGIALAEHLFEVLIHERLYRDLREAERLNEAIARIEALAAAGKLTHVQLAEVLDAVGARRLRITTIRPDVELPGNSFAGFLHRELREQYIAAGRDAAHAALDALRL
jgi:NTE family protein